MDAIDPRLLWILIAYFVAAIPVGLLIGLAKGVDLRAIGSGNIGATNAVRALGRPLGILVFALDVAKAALPVSLAVEPLTAVDHPQWSVAAVGLAAVLGHVFPIYLGFRGGKGVACALGILGVIQPVAAAVALVLYVQTLLLTRVSAVGSLTALSAGTAVVLVTDTPWPHRALILAMAAIIGWRHRNNVREVVADAKAAKAARRTSRGD
jgi:glycerol-3-phosphate acyltransferase PlsY